MTAIQADFSAFVTERQRPLLRFATALSGDPRMAEEIVTDVLSKAWEHWDRIATLDYPNSYVRKMVVNEFLSWRRRLKRTSYVADIADYPDATGDHATDHADRGALIDQLASLPRKQRAALLLRYDEGMSDDEIAEVMGCSAVTVRSNTSRALATLRIRLEAPDPSRHHRPLTITPKGEM